MVRSFLAGTRQYRKLGRHEVTLGGQKHLNPFAPKLKVHNENPKVKFDVTMVAHSSTRICLVKTY